MTGKSKLSFIRARASILALLAASCAHGQAAPVADHHAHLQSPTAARLLNEGASRELQTLGGEEKASTAAELIAQLDVAGTKRSVALSDAYRLGSPFVHVPHEATAVDAENDWTLRQVRMYPDRLVGFCSVNPIRPYALAAIQHCADIGLRGGLKLHLANARFHFDNPAQVRQLNQVFAAADRLRMPILIHLRNGETWHGRQAVQILMDQILPAAHHVPVQIAHLGGWGGYDRSTNDTLSAFAERCEEHPDRCRQLYFDISAVVLPPAYATAKPGSDDRTLWEEQNGFTDGQERLAANLRRIGLSRILFGTDWPAITTKEYADLLRHSLKLSPSEVDQILSNLAPYFP